MTTAVWIDRNVAKIFSLSESSSDVAMVFHAHRKDHHTHRFDHLDQDRMDHHLHEEVVHNLPTSGEIVILGPGVARFHFYNFLKEHRPLFSKRVVACEAVDHLTDAQVTAKARLLVSQTLKTGS